MADPTLIGERLKAIREGHGHSAQVVADLLKCNRSNVFHIEAGRGRPSVEQLRTLARHYGCLIEQLLEGPLPIGDAKRPLETPTTYTRVLVAAKDKTLDEPKHHPFSDTEVTREMTRREIEAALDRREAAEVADSLRRLGIDLTDEQRLKLSAKAGAAA